MHSDFDDDIPPLEPPAPGLPGVEPPLTEDDTQPRRPTAARAAPPPGWRREPPAPRRALLYLTVMSASACLCLLLVALAGVAGYRDGLATSDARVTQTLATGIAQQYATGVADFEQGYAELAVARFAWIVETVGAPTQYAQDSAERLATARVVAAYTATPAPTGTPAPSLTPPPTATVTPPPTAAASPTSEAAAPGARQDPAALFERAQTALNVSRYEEAIEWLDALRALDPTYRQGEVTAALIQALTSQGKIYLRGQNADGEDRLMRGVTLVYRAADLGPVDNLLLGEAIFVEDYINARNYVNGGYYAQALLILEDLCNRNCDWGYPNLNPVTVRDLLQAAQAGASAGS